MNQKGSVFLIILVVAALLGTGAYVFLKNPNLFKQQPVACTQEAKLCPDGSSVGRSGPNCEFTPCPSVQPTVAPNETSGWKTYRNEKYKFEFEYPSTTILSQLKGPDYKGGPIYDGINIKYAESIDKQPYKDRPDLYGYAISLTIYQGNDKQQVVGLFDKSIEGCSEQAECSGSIETQIGGVVAKTYSFKTKLETYTHMTKYHYFEKNGYLYVFAVGTAGSKDLFDKYTEVISQILSTFKFIDTKTTAYPTPTSAKDKCKTGGCSQELCISASSKDVVSICLYKKEYGCLSASRCKVQSNGTCGWTQTPEYKKCLIEIDAAENGRFCGGFAGEICPDGYRCQLDGNYPDAGGTCIKL